MDKKRCKLSQERMKKFAVCSFLDEDNAMHVVPSSWILSKQSVKWPKSGLAKSLNDKCLDIKGEWVAKNIKIYSMASTLDSAEKKLDKGLETSNVSDSSDAEMPEKDPKKRIHNSDNSDVDDPNYNKKNTLPQSPFGRRSRINYKKFKASNLKSPSSSSINSCEAVQVDKLDESETGQNDSCDPFIKKILRLLLDLQTRLKHLKQDVKENSQKIDRLDEKMNNSPGTAPNPSQIIYHNETAEFNLPISTTEQLSELEQQLLDDQKANKLCLHLSTRPASSMKQMVLSIMKYLLSRNVALEFNLNGLKDKKKFASLHICNIIIGAVQIMYKEESTAYIMKRISLVLAGARDWDGERKKRLSNNIVT